MDRFKEKLTEEVTGCVFVNPSPIAQEVIEKAVTLHNEITEKYRELMLMSGVPLFLIENPSIMNRQQPSEEAIRWAKETIKMYENK